MLLKAGMKYLVAFILALATSSAYAICPDTARGETQEDCPWAGIARALSQQAQTRRLTPADLEQASPSLSKQIAHDSREIALKALWGKSINYDELANAIIIDPAILKTLASAFRVKLTDAMLAEHLSHAGMEHTYGYLFSNLKTSFGYKRARWVHGDIERGFGLPVGTFGPQAPEVSGGTLFSNVTYFFGRIAFHDDAGALKILENHSGGVAKALREFNYLLLKPVRFEETIPSKGVVLRTDLVVNLWGKSYLLVYSVVTNGKPRLITGFPVDQGFVDSLLSKDELGTGKPITTRYNAYVEGVSGSVLPGTRRMIQPE